MDMDILEIYPKNAEPETLEIMELLISENNLPFAWEESFDGGVGCFKVYSFGSHPLKELKIQWDEKFPNSEFIWKEMDSESWSSGWSEEEISHWKSSNFEVFIGEENLHKASDKVIVLEHSPHVFGDGQHTSTTLMLDAMEEEISKKMPERVLDFGAGSGILAIGAYKVGVKNVDACEIDDNALQIAKVNGKRNNCEEVGFYQYLPVELRYDFIMCNVQPPLLNSLLPELNAKLDKKGIVILSGYTTLDKRGIEVAMEQLNFQHVKDYKNKGWLATAWKRID